MKQFILYILVVLFPFFLFRQSKPTVYDKMIGLNYPCIDTSNSDMRSITKLWKKYLMARIYGIAFKIDTAGYFLWNEEEKQLYNDPDLILSDPIFYWNQTNLINIKYIGQGYFQLTNVKGWVDDSTGNYKTTSIFYVLAKKVNEKFKLFNYFYLDKKRLKQKKIGNVCYYYPQKHKFNKQDAVNFINFEDSLSRLFNCPLPISMSYILDENEEDLMKHFGYFYYPSGTGKNGGKCLYKDTMILSSINENHRHELVHYFTQNKNPDVIGFFDEGLATYFGGNIGKPFQWHLNHLYAYIKDKPELDISNPIKFQYIDDKSNPQYVLGAIIIRYTITKYGFPKVLKLLQYSKKQNSFPDVIEIELGIKKTDLNSFFRNYITELATKPL